MKRNPMPRPAFLLLIAGLLIPAVVSILSRCVPLPDGLSGFVAGVGIGLELMALISIRRHKARRTGKI